MTSKQPSTRLISAPVQLALLASSAGIMLGFK